MKSSEEISKVVSKNIAEYRKVYSITQAELAESIGYSDKSVSKWEQGNGLPDLVSLMNIAEAFSVTPNDLLLEHDRPIKKPRRKWLDFTNKNLITILACSACWVVAVLVFVFLKLFAPNVTRPWLAFLYAVPASGIVSLVLASVFHFPVLRFISITGLIWTILTCIFVTCLPKSYPILFLIGVPLQFSVIIAYLLAHRIKKSRKNKLDVEK